MSCLDGIWDFLFLGDVDLDACAPESLRDWTKTGVPSAFDATPDLAGKRGVAAYRRRLSIPAGHSAKLSFGAVSMRCRVFVDGVCLREHACGYAPFGLELEASDDSERELVLLVDNRFDFEHTPMHEPYFDFYQYGGILRSVMLQVFPDTKPSIDWVKVAPTERYRDGEVSLHIGLRGAVSDSMTLLIAWDHGNEQSYTGTIIDGEITLTARVPNPSLWSPESPLLHAVHVRIKDESHASGSQQARFGLRWIEAREGALWLNGEQLQLRGYNRHEWHPNFGPCTPPLQMLNDLQHLRDLGCNFIRGSHYPQDQRFLDLCDELGFLVWEENLGWGQRERTLTNETFRAQHLESLRAMVHASYNHPCVIIWGFLNEAGSDQPYARPIIEESAVELRQLDATRLVSFASMYALTDICFDLVDLIAINIYPGWYDCDDVEDPLALIAPYMQKCFDHFSSDAYADKPVIISEIGAEGLYGWHEPHHDFYTEAYQANYLRIACQEALEHPRSSGIALWHFSDARTYGTGRSIKRPRTFNNKGTLDEYRRPKLAYQAVRDVFNAYTS
ncbi:glycoside hydrolase family 2 TIM barrel-domain containing protein [Coraliomargarita algicola]|uniref:Glycoside hydrolase family 2 TIM barrel-domain containing protein n=1 Tax=Coraliomargarita algicola TaxID=3092156 RepID=A0ABZ0RLH6_9BACT|nr:glycoside hydrolase family 2 TIM barrel-domain containing protein [Coraliomargarita sp. J2-16]WPJ96932.1 glycoside hydrolase family 2 TIM barrel-domain containing protein [Coraliomargarita sp. J2-16]